MISVKKLECRKIKSDYGSNIHSDLIFAIFTVIGLSLKTTKRWHDFKVPTNVQKLKAANRYNNLVSKKNGIRQYFHFYSTIILLLDIQI